jgi:hypothetical protein
MTVMNTSTSAPSAAHHFTGALVGASGATGRRVCAAVDCAAESINMANPFLR